jgi:hypothetical protein
MKNRIIFIPLMVLVLCSFTKESKKKITNKLYSINVPSDWAPNYPGRLLGDGSIPMENDANGFHLYFFSWSSPIENDEDFKNMVSVNIESYKRNKGKSVTIKEVEEISQNFINQTVSDGSLKIIRRKNLITKNGRKYFVLELSDQYKTLNAISWVKSDRYYYFAKKNDIVHKIEITMPSQLSSISKKEIVESLIDSFTVL